MYIWRTCDAIFVLEKHFYPNEIQIHNLHELNTDVMKDNMHKCLFICNG